MRFAELMIGDRFVSIHGPTGVSTVVYEKKSLSSAYVLNAETLKREKLIGHAEICGFTGAVKVLAVRS